MRLERHVDPEEQPLGPVALVVVPLDGEAAEHVAGRLLTGVARLENDLHERVLPPDAADQLLAVHDRHEVVDEHQMDRLALEQRQRLRAAVGREHAVPLPLEEHADGRERLHLIVDDQDRSSAGLDVASDAHRALPAHPDRLHGTPHTHRFPRDEGSLGSDESAVHVSDRSAAWREALIFQATSRGRRTRAGGTPFPVGTDGHARVPEAARVGRPHCRAAVASPCQALRRRRRHSV